ncbi:hypothetical protein CNE_1c11730 [Cupriavidus necator N-1]|uniref:Uncharacterized protein n=1 Tax=Cupriavidus necator (strain ATCC 43291 / DSM 13513 / CCUG 52238 / LMG 8453 / N-1) TaxID=1042878 RepID=G0ER10_CUPNN|nr:hypothetical protein CNE_1c11730 [Cupriavidus necator N-1]
MGRSPPGIRPPAAAEHIQEEAAMIAFRIVLDGRRAYVGLFRCTFDAIEDGFNRGARTVAAKRITSQG